VAWLVGAQLVPAVGTDLAAGRDRLSAVRTLEDDESPGHRRAIVECHRAADRVEPAPAPGEGEQDQRDGRESERSHRADSGGQSRFWTTRPSLRPASAARVLPGVEVRRVRTLPSPSANCTTPGCQLPNCPANGVVGPRASGKAVPALRPVT